MAPEAYDYETYSRLAGPLTRAGPEYRVRYRSLLSRGRHRVRATLLLGAAPSACLVMLIWLMWPSHWAERSEGPPWLVGADAVMLVSLGLIEVFRLINVVSVAHATLVACDPIPVRPRMGTRVAFLTTYVPGKEPLSMVRATLEAAVRVRHRGRLHVWLLDEGDDPDARALCAELGVHHFTRKGVEDWNRPRGPHRAKTKHGNYNSWLDAHGDDYEFFASVDTDHVPLPAFLERMLGYFRDPDVAFVVGPQVYGNYRGIVTKFAESQQFLFHALIQRAGNRYGSPMFVGTNNCVRVSALKSIGGLRDSITEDMATGFELHRRRNPETRRRWRSVYTPDVLAVGEGPESWTDFFTQQLRWSRGTYETLLTQFGRTPHRHSAGRLLSYSLMLAYYPMSGLTWMLGALSCTLFLWVGASGTQVPPSLWLMFYGDAAALQIGLYLWNRRHNVSPHEPKGSTGLAGMLMSALSAPIYARSLIAAAFRRPCRFVVTPKGGSVSLDQPATFRTHLWWAAAVGVSLTASAVLGHTHVAMRVWSLLALAVALGPAVVWWYAQGRDEHRIRELLPAAARKLRAWRAPAAPGGAAEAAGAADGSPGGVTDLARTTIPAGAPGQGETAPAFATTSAQR
ncbi:cellulose synthase catalytic subunit [Streptomyces sp. N2-109]|uniref:Cellulose synthase catalytic subunit n=1 Tax=Streptomyces gossypii TaxID=2883101 RepID=A0ABT2JX55_9ACTN|nr:cellulose synthase catalytic subunit [Streptomyces gossypii]MCT2592461.1 cellulose synthase catalytic subunit [Streptomyces gossypii]